MLRSFLAALSILVFIACSDGITVTTDISAPESAPEIELNELARYYTDTLPCASCEGIVTGIAILNDSTYFLTELYLSEQSIPFGRMGRYTREGDQLFLQFDEDSVIRFKIEGNQLRKLDKNGGEILSGQDVTLEEEQMPESILERPFLADGVYSINNKLASFQPCNQPVAWMVLQDKEAKDAERFFIKNKEKEDNQLLVRASIQLQPAATDSIAGSYEVKIIKINNKLGTTCR